MRGRTTRSGSEPPRRSTIGSFPCSAVSYVRASCHPVLPVSISFGSGAARSTRTVRGPTHSFVPTSGANARNTTRMIQGAKVRRSSRKCSSVLLALKTAQPETRRPSPLPSDGEGYSDSTTVRTPTLRSCAEIDPRRFFYGSGCSWCLTGSASGAPDSITTFGILRLFSTCRVAWYGQSEFDNSRLSRVAIGGCQAASLRGSGPSSRRVSAKRSPAES